jgi:hypothetical protein
MRSRARNNQDQIEAFEKPVVKGDHHSETLKPDRILGLVGPQSHIAIAHKLGGIANLYTECF